MPLRGDQRALLQLLCERGQSYEDISGLLGVSPDDVRAQARAALGDIGGADPDAEVGLTDFLLGQADPIGRADAIRYLQSDPDSLELARKIEGGLMLVAPEATLPKLPEPRGKRARAATLAPGEPLAEPAGGDPPAAGSRSAAPPANPRQNQLIAALGAIGVILLFAVLAIAGVFSGSDSSANESLPPTTTSADGSTTSTTSDERNITTVKLTPTDGSGVAGTAKFGLANQSQLFIDLQLSGLPLNPSQKTTNLLWLMVGPTAGYPANNPVDSPIRPDQNGNYSGQIAVPGPVAQTIGGQAMSVKLSSSPIRAIADAAKKASRQQAPVLGFIGTELASGEIPLVRDSGAGARGGGTTTPAPGGTPTSPGGGQAPGGG